jgi:hypothetical protein
MGRIGSAMSLPDADPKFCTQLMTVIAGKLRAGHGLPGGAPSPGAPGGPPGGPGGPGAPPGLQMPGAPGPGGPIVQPPQMMGGLTPGLNPMATANNPDEMRRIIQQITS